MKKFLVLLVSVALVCGALFAQGSAEEQKQLIISTWGLSEDTLWSEVYEPFEKANGAEIVLDTGNAQERFTRLVNDPNSTIDIIELSQKNTADGVIDGVFATIKPEEITSFDDLLPAAQEIIRSGSGAPYTINSIGIIYDPESTGFEIKNWKDLWDPRLENKIAVPNITTTFGPAFMAMCSDVAGVDWVSDNGDTAFAQLEALKGNIANVYSKSSDVANQLANGEIAAAIVGDFAIPIAKKAAPQSVYVVPEEGTYANFNVINITKNCKDRALALAYINYRLSAESESRTCQADILNEAPINMTVELAEADKKNKTVDDVAARAKMVDFTFVKSNMASLVDRFNRMMSK